MAYEYHSGEVAVQSRAGVRDMAKRLAGSIHSVVPGVARAFLEERRFVVLGTSDTEGRPWASILTGSPGFARALDGHTVRIAARPVSGDPLETNVRAGSFAGLIAPDLTTRRRLRINGRLEPTNGAILIHVDQAYSNCPKYIQLRAAEGEKAEASGRLVRRSKTFSPHQRDWIRRADTFFIATLNPGEGADASHRGGMPGFVSVEDQELIWADYPGNSMFNTLGNIAKYPRAGILVPDFNTRSTLQLTGRAVIDWDSPRSAGETGFERLVRFVAEDVVEIENVLPPGLQLVEYSPFNPKP